MKKFKKLATLAVTMVLALAFISCDNGNGPGNEPETPAEENDGAGTGGTQAEENVSLVGTYNLSTRERIYKHKGHVVYSDGEDSEPELEYSTTYSMLTSTSIHYAHTRSVTEGGKTNVEEEIDLTVTKTSGGYSFNWTKYNVHGVAQGDEAKSEEESNFTDDTWTYWTNEFAAMTITTTADGTWSDNGCPSSSGTYTVDEANSKIKLTTLVDEGTTLDEPEETEATYSDNGRTIVVVEDESTEKTIDKTTLTFTRH